MKIQWEYDLVERPFCQQLQALGWKWLEGDVNAPELNRAHRIGQTRPVFAYRMICRDTVEEKIVELQREKRELADAIVSADNSLIRNLSSDDLRMLLS